MTWGKSVEDFSMLEIDEGVHIDHTRLAELSAQLGPAAAEDVMCRGVEEVSIQICKIEAALRRADIYEVAKLARGLMCMADTVGLATLARVAGDVANCASFGDHVALAATVRRLGRIGDGSVVAVWDLHGMSV
ncbi:MAG: hypothetical protein AAF667_12695 [Pseudomonadota bacterium]